jgi:hypothetical protein
MSLTHLQRQETRVRAVAAQAHREFDNWDQRQAGGRYPRCRRGGWRLTRRRPHTSLP